MIRYLDPGNPDDICEYSDGSGGTTKIGLETETSGAITPRLSNQSGTTLYVSVDGPVKAHTNPSDQKPIAVKRDGRRGEKRSDFQEQPRGAEEHDRSSKDEIVVAEYDEGPP